MYAVRISGEVTGNEFEGDLTTEVLVVCEIDLAHSAHAERTENLEAPDLLSGQEFARFTCEHSLGKFECGRT